MFLPVAGAIVSSILPPYQQLVQEIDDKDSGYEQRVQKFLEQTKGDDDYEEKITSLKIKEFSPFIYLFVFKSL